MPNPPWILIDGYNLLHASGVFGTGGRTPLESSREALLDWLSEVLGEAERQRTTIVFDARDAPPGLPRSARKHGIEIHFAPRGRDADELIEQLIGEHSVPRSLIVVSSDHRIQRAARRRRATPIDSDRWIAELHPPRTNAATTDRSADAQAEDLQKWLDEFRISDG